ncbi:response regulator [Baekduia soli]|nr:response regulator transcription factor [Baekduia soli]
MPDAARHEPITIRVSHTRPPVMSTIRVLIADDHPLVRVGLRRALADDGRFAVVGEAGDGRQAVVLAERLAPDLCVFDVRMPGVDGIEAMTDVVRARPEARVVLLSAFDDDVVIGTARSKGAVGYLTKDTERDLLCDALARAAAGEAVFAGPDGDRPMQTHPSDTSIG